MHCFKQLLNNQNLQTYCFETPLETSKVIPDWREEAPVAADPVQEAQALELAASASKARMAAFFRGESAAAVAQKAAEACRRSQASTRSQVKAQVMAWTVEQVIRGNILTIATNFNPEELVILESFHEDVEEDDTNV